MEDLNAASLQDVKDWYASYYGPNNVVLALAGDITAERALALVKKADGIPPVRRWNASSNGCRLDAPMRDSMFDRGRRRVYRVYTRRRGATTTSRAAVFASVSAARAVRELDRRLVYDRTATTVTASTETLALRACS
jgi:zinc protease